MRIPTILPKPATIASLFLVGAGVASCFVLAYFLYQYTWTGRQFGSFRGPVLYYILPATSALVFFSSLRLKPLYRTRLAILCGSLGVAAYVADVFLSALQKAAWGEVTKSRKQEVLNLAKQYGVDFDTRDNTEVIADLRKRGVEAVPQIILPMLEQQADGTMMSRIHIRGVETAPLGGIAKTVTVMCNQSGRYVIYTTDKHGFRNPEGMWNAAPLEIAAVGNSFAQGYCVPSDKDFVSLLRKQHPATLNLGMAGEGPLLMLAAISEYLVELRPKIVLWCYFDGDHLMDLQNEKKSPLLRRYIEPGFSQRLFVRQKEIDRALWNYIENAEKLRITTQKPEQHKMFGQLVAHIKLSQLREKFGMLDNKEALEAANELKGSTTDLFQKVLLQAKSRVESWGGKLYFVYLPSWARYATNNPGIVAMQRSKILNFVKDANVPVVDLHPAFQAHSDPLSLFPFRRFHHYNEKGHQLVAQEILKPISSTN